MNMSDKVLIAGPWLGEFGWELFAWHGYIRALAEEFDETICITRKNSKNLYTDFADKVLEYDSNVGVPDMFFMPNVQINGILLNSILKENNIDISDKNVTWLPARKIGQPPMTHFSEAFTFGNLKIKPKYVIFGNKSGKYDYIFHIRRRPLREEDNWDMEKWSKLLELLVKNGEKVACIGTKNASGHIEGTTDLRNMPMSDTIEALSGARCCFGSSSGPMHLASLCGTPHVVWSIMYNHVRYTKNWNPHETPVLFLGDHAWHPEPEYVYEKFKPWMESVK